MKPTAPVSAAPAPVVAALRAMPGGAAMLRAQPRICCLKTGRTNQTWRVTGAGDDWIVRIGVGADARLAVDRAREAELLARVADAGFAPRLIGFSDDHRVLVVRYVAAPQPDEPTARGPAFAHQLGARLRALHELAVPADAVPLDLRAVFAHYLAIAAPQHEQLPRALVRSLVALQLQDYAPVRIALCHHDVHRANVRLTEPLTLIDWEYAGYGDPLIDLASYVSYESPPDEAVAALLAGYGAAAGVDAGSLGRAARLFDCLHALWLDAADAWSDLPERARAGLCARLAAQARSARLY